jgi:hypothetical protein
VASPSTRISPFWTAQLLGWGTYAAAKYPVSSAPLLLVGIGAALSLPLRGLYLGQPNGITWDARRNRFPLGPVVGDSAVQEWKEGMRAPAKVARGIGRYDGIEVLPDGRTLVSAWNDSTVSEIVGNAVRPLIRGVPTAADIGVDPGAGVVAIPILTGDRVELWRLPPRGP